MANWQQNGCDLWEEVRSDDFFWNRMGYVYSLNNAADLAVKLGKDPEQYKEWRALAGEIRNDLQTHWNGNFLWESQNREVDGAVIHAIATFGSDNYGALSPWTASTIKHYNEVFCVEYKINKKDNDANVPGILYGRYPGDHYAGGNPWQLLTAVLGELFYKGAKEMQERQALNGDFTLSNEEFGEWKDLLKLDENATAEDFIKASTSAGDAVMTRLWTHVKNDHGRIDE